MLLFVPAMNLEVRNVQTLSTKAKENKVHLLETDIMVPSNSNLIQK